MTDSLPTPSDPPPRIASSGSVRPIDPVDEASVAQLVLELEVARRRGAQSRVVAQAALVVAGFAMGAAVWSISRAGDATSRADRVERELQLDRAARAAEPQVDPRVRIVRPAPPPAPVGSPSAERDETWMADALLLEIDGLESALGRLETRLSEVEGGLVEWGAETKRYVDSRLQAQPSPSPLRSAELNELWLRVEALEQRLGGR